MLQLLTADADPIAVETCPADDALATDPASPLHAHAPNRGAPQNPRPEPDCSQISGSVASRQLLSVAPIGLHSVADLHRDQRRGYHLALNA
jgi:hypothetical protein